MMANRDPGPSALSDLLEELDDEDPDASFLRWILKSAASRDPDLPDLVRAAAIPRVLTSAIIGVLRGAPDDSEGNERFLELLSEYRFVLRRGEGGLVYHDNTRDALLSDWRSTEESEQRFVALNEALAGYYEARYEERSRA